MKKLDELGISQTPWEMYSNCWIKSSKGDSEIACTFDDTNVNATADARLIAAAPELYEVAAWCKEQADEIGKCCVSGGVNPYALAQCMAGIVRRCEAALAAASGEREVNNER